MRGFNEDPRRYGNLVRRLATVVAMSIPLAGAPRAAAAQVDSTCVAVMDSAYYPSGRGGGTVPVPGSR